LAIKEIKGISKASEKFKRAIESLERVEEIFEEKNNRIKIASRGVCPYSGHKIQTGEIDHILQEA
jgi:hypothetical protein